MDSHQASMEMSDSFFPTDQDLVAVEKVREKNRQIQKLLDEIAHLEDDRKKTDSQINKLTSQLADATDQLNRSAADMKMLHNRILEVQKMNHQLVKDKEVLLAEMDQLTNRLQDMKDEDEKMAKEFSNQVDRVIQVMNEKDEEIKKLTERMKNLPAISTDEDADGRRDIHRMRDQLEQATQTIEYQTRIIDQLRVSLTESKSGPSSTHGEEDHFLYQRLEEAEAELQEKDDKILKLTIRIRDYEEGHYGLPDAIRELEGAKSALERKDKQISDLTTQLNDLSLELNDTQDELEYIKECVGGNVDLEAITSAAEGKSGQSRSDKLKVLRLQQQLIKLEDEKIDVEEELRSLKGKLSDLKSTETNQEVLTRMAELEAESRDLKLGLKEVLLSIHEMDDNSPEVTIECPTLERLCRFLESRSISEGPFSTVIPLKAELDVMRGYNEQLRQQLKATRLEHLRVLALYAEEVMASDESAEVIGGHDFAIEDESTYSEGQVPSTIEEDVPIREQDFMMPTAPPFSPPEEEDYDIPERPISPQPPAIPPPVPPRRMQRFPAIEVSEVDGHRDVATQTEVEMKSKPEVTSSSVITIKRCSRCSKLLRVLNDVKSRLTKTEKSIKASEDSTFERICQIERDHVRSLEVISNLEDENRVLKNLLHSTSVQKVSRLTDTKPSHQVVDLTALVPVPPLSHQVIISDDDHLTADSSDHKERYAEIIESVIRCLQERLDRKQETIKVYERLLDETKDTFEQELTNNNQLTASYIDQLMKDNEELGGVLSRCMTELNDLKSEAKIKIERLEVENEQLKKKVDQLPVTQTPLPTSEKHQPVSLVTPNQLTVLRTEVAHLKEEVMSKEKLIESLSKSLKEERILRMSSIKVDVQPTSGQADAELEKLKKEVADKKKVLRDLELAKWESEKKWKEQLVSVMTKLTASQEDNKKLNDYLTRMKALMDKKDRRRSSVHSSVGYSKVDKEAQTEVDLLQTEKENELRILLMESLEREKATSLKMTSCQSPTGKDPDHVLLSENASLKVQLRMTEFELKKKNK